MVSSKTSVSSCISRQYLYSITSGARYYKLTTHNWVIETN